MITTTNGDKRFDELVFEFLRKKYHFKKRLTDLENKAIRETEINELLKQAEIELDAVVCFMDATGALRYVSPKHDEFFGKKAIGDDNADHTHPDDLPMLGKVDSDYLMKGKPCGWVFRYKAEDEYKKVFTKCYPVLDENNELKAYFSTSELVDDSFENRIVEIA